MKKIIMGKTYAKDKRYSKGGTFDKTINEHGTPETESVPSHRPSYDEDMEEELHSPYYKEHESVPMHDYVGGEIRAEYMARAKLRRDRCRSYVEIVSRCDLDLRSILRESALTDMVIRYY